MQWHIEVTPQFEGWWDDLTEKQQEILDDRIQLLGERGPELKRPVVGKIVGSRHPNMKELIASTKGAELRVLFAFDPRRSAVLLLGGDKSGQWNKWYASAIELADELFDKHLAEIDTEK